MMRVTRILHKNFETGGNSDPIQPLKGWFSQNINEFKTSDLIKRNFTITIGGMFYAPALLCAHLALGADKIAFAVDYPYEKTEHAVRFIKEAPISDIDKEKIFYSNAERLLKIWILISNIYNNYYKWNDKRNG